MPNNPGAPDELTPAVKAGLLRQLPLSESRGVEQVIAHGNGWARQRTWVWRSMRPDRRGGKRYIELGRHAACRRFRKWLRHQGTWWARQAKGGHR